MNYATFLSLLLIFGAPLLSFYYTVPALAANSTSNSTHILLSCGTSETSTDNVNNLTWIGDSKTNYISQKASQTSPIPYRNPSVPDTPYSNARIFTSNYTYSFPLSPGRYFLRLYFYPTNYSNYPAANSFFTATAGPYTIFSNFSALITVNALNYAYLIREFSINVTSSTLNLTFSPSTKQPNAYAFVNGIEIMSSPDIFSSPRTYYANGVNTSFQYDPGTAFQTMYRLNVGGRPLGPSEDSGLYRSWDDDSNYLFGAAFGVTFQNDPNVTIEYPPTIPQYIAPVEVYETARSMGPTPQINLNYNLTWILNVDAGFYYLLRFHFCEIQYPMTKINQRVFFIYINNQTAQSKFDVIKYSGGIGIPTYMDYVVIPPGSGSGQMDMWVALHPDLSTKTEYFDAILNGLEVFKMSIPENNLAGLNPVPIAQNTINPTLTNGNHNSLKQKVAKIIGLVIGVPCGVLFFSLVVYFLFVTCKRQKKKETESAEGKISDGTTVRTPLSLCEISNSQSDVSSKTNTTGTGTGTGNGSYNSSLPANICRHFSFIEILAATNEFDDSRVLGLGRFGKVYQGEIDNRSTKVAIKRANPLSDQGFHEFQTEIEMLSKLRHRHLVSLIGYCEDQNEMILVYDYMAHGTLREHLYKSPNAPLTWNQRLEICIGAARGIHYLHTGAKHTVIHRDVNSTNILLDEKWVAKMSDFGLSKIGPTLDQSHVSTVVRGVSDT